MGGRGRAARDPGGGRYRHYLLWITELPPGEDHVEISEMELFRQNR